MEKGITYKEFREDLRKWFSKDSPEGGWKRIGTDGQVLGPCARPDKDGDGVEPHEFMKQCPCFDAEVEYMDYQPKSFKPKSKKARDIKKSKSKK